MVINMNIMLIIKQFLKDFVYANSLQSSDWHCWMDNDNGRG